MMQLLPSSLEMSRACAWNKFQPGNLISWVPIRSPREVNRSSSGNTKKTDVLMKSRRWNGQAHAFHHTSMFHLLTCSLCSSNFPWVGGANCWIHVVQHRWSLEEVAMRINLLFVPRVSHKCSSSSIERQKHVRKHDHWHFMHVHLCE